MEVYSGKFTKNIRKQSIILSGETDWRKQFLHNSIIFLQILRDAIDLHIYIYTYYIITIYIYLIYIYMVGSKNNGTPKSSILIGFSIINHPFWDTPIFRNTHTIIYTFFLLLLYHKCPSPICLNHALHPHVQLKRLLAVESLQEQRPAAMFCWNTRYHKRSQSLPELESYKQRNHWIKYDKMVKARMLRKRRDGLMRTVFK